MFLILRPLRLLLQAFVMESTPRQMSLGLAFGVLVGLVPKGNLLAIVLCTFVATVCDSIFDQIGGYILAQPSLQGMWTEMANMPFMPWTNFNNTIVMGSFATGLVLLWPVHRLSRPLFEKYAEKIAQRARRWRWAKLILGAEWADRIAAIH